MKVLIIPEDPRLDQYMLKPLIEAALKKAGKPRAKVSVCQDASLRGDATIIDFDAVKDIIEDNQLYDAFLLCVDRDCRETRPDTLKNLETRIREACPNKVFVAVCGVEELEVWVLAGLSDLEEPWSEVRAECHPKERYFDSYVARKGHLDTPGRGRQVLGKVAASKYSQRIREMCPEIRACEI